MNYTEISRNEETKVGWSWYTDNTIINEVKHVSSSLKTLFNIEVIINKIIRNGYGIIIIIH